MKVLFFTKEYPPHVYGGAGVHVEHLSAELAREITVEVRCFGDQNDSDPSLAVRGFQADASAFSCPAHLRSTLEAARIGVDFTTAGLEADLVHCHTWYAHFAGILAKLNYGLPLVVTVHSLEPLRPWKREQLGRGYDFSVWVEKTALEMADAVIAVSEGTRADVLRLFDVPPDRVRTIFNGIDCDLFRKVSETGVLRRHGIDPERPYVLFVGRITRQKGIIHLVESIRHMDPGFQVVLVAGAPDTEEIAREMAEAVARAAAERGDVHWIGEMQDRENLIQFYSHAALFCCPSIYEPFGIINLEAMACETPVVAARVGGIPEVVVDGETGLLVPVEQDDQPPYEPREPGRFARDLAGAVNRLMADPDLRTRMALAGRKWAVEEFSWRAIAAQTRELYTTLLAKRIETHARFAQDAKTQRWKRMK